MDQNILINVWLIVKRSKLDNGNAVCFCVGEHNVVRGYIMKTIMVVMMISDDIRLLPLFVAGLIDYKPGPKFEPVSNLNPNLISLSEKL